MSGSPPQSFEGFIGRSVHCV